MFTVSQADSDEQEFLLATITNEVITPTACDHAGIRTYTATATAENGTIYTDTKTEEIAQLPHTYGAPTWTWDGFAAKATFACTGCTDKQVLTAAVTNEITTPATCTASGVRTYTAAVTFEGKTYTDTKTEEMPYTYTTAWAWDGFDSATVTLTCPDCEKAVQQAADITSEITIPATCTASGVRTYTATVVYEGVTYTDTKTEEIPISDPAVCQLTAVTPCDLNGAALAAIPQQAFLAQVQVQGKVDGATGVVVVTMYDAKGRCLGAKFLAIDPLSVDETATLSATFDNTNGKGVKLKAFLFPSLTDFTPVGAALTFENP